MENDYELLYLAKEDKDIVAEILYKKYYKIIYSKALKYSSSNSLIEDYVNEAKISLYDAIENYQDKYKFSTYLNNCIDNRLLNYKKSLNRNKHKLLNEAISFEDINIQYQINDSRNNQEDLIIEEENYVNLKNKILDKLTWKEELIFKLKEQNFTNKEISEITDNKLKTIYNIVNRIQNKMSKIMSNNNN